MSASSNVGASGSHTWHYRERALSSASLASSGDWDDVPDVPSASTRPKLTRKRFSESQVAQMEALYRSTTHPSRAKREELARDIDMEAKQVTVWFQNRRQADRKVERTESFEASRHASSGSNASLNQCADGSRRRVTLRPLHAHMSSTASTSALSLDAIATREERRAERYAQGPSPDEKNQAAVARPGTLEWACAQERVAHRLGERPPVLMRPRKVSFTATTAIHGSPSKTRGALPTEQQPPMQTHDIAQKSLMDSRDEDGAGETDIGEDTEDEAHEAITPAGSLLADAFKAAGAHAGRGKAREPAHEEDDELMNAALVLAGLGRHG